MHRTLGTGVWTVVTAGDCRLRTGLTAWVGRTLLSGKPEPGRKVGKPEPGRKVRLKVPVAVSRRRLGLVSPSPLSTCSCTCLAHTSKAPPKTCVERQLRPYRGAQVRKFLPLPADLETFYSNMQYDTVSDRQRTCRPMPTDTDKANARVHLRNAARSCSPLMLSTTRSTFCTRIADELLQSLARLAVRVVAVASVLEPRLIVHSQLIGRQAIVSGFILVAGDA